MRRKVPGVWKRGRHNPPIPVDLPKPEDGTWLERLVYVEEVARAKLIISLERALDAEARRIETYRRTRSKKAMTQARKAYYSAQEVIDKLNRLEHLSARRQKAIADGWIIVCLPIGRWNAAKKIVAEMIREFEHRDIPQDQGFGLEDIPVLKWPDVWFRRNPATADFVWRLEDAASRGSVGTSTVSMLRKFAKEIKISVGLE